VRGRARGLPAVLTLLGDPLAFLGDDLAHHLGSPLRRHLGKLLAHPIHHEGEAGFEVARLALG